MRGSGPPRRDHDPRGPVQSGQGEIPAALQFREQPLDVGGVARGPGRLGAAGATLLRDEATDLLLINEEYSATLVLSRCRPTPVGTPRWLVRIDQHLAPDITILACMDAANGRPADYYLLPVMDADVPRLLLCGSNGARLDTSATRASDAIPVRPQGRDLPASEPATRTPVEELRPSPRSARLHRLIRHEGGGGTGL